METENDLNRENELEAETLTEEEQNRVNQMVTEYLDLVDYNPMMANARGFGRNWWNSRGFVAGIIDVVAITIAIAGWGAVSSAVAVRKILTSNVGKRLTSGIAIELSRRFGCAVGKTVGTALNIGLTVTNASIGSIIAFGLDKVDGRFDGYIFA